MSLPSAQCTLSTPPRPAGTGTAQSPTTPATSLIDPVPGHPDVDVPARLHQFAQMPGMQDAVKAIFLLIDQEPIPATTDDASCQKAAGVLLELGQGRLLCRLAEDRQIEYPLQVGPPQSGNLLLGSDQRARLLADISASWPLHTPVSLTLGTTLSSNALQALHAFLQRPITLKVNLLLQDTGNEAPVHALAKALHLRTFSALSLHCVAPELETLKTLCGIQTQAIRLQFAEQSQAALEDGAVKFHLCQLVDKSGAEKLDVAHASVPAGLATSLLGLTKHWSRVDLRLENEVTLQLINNRLGKLKIEHLSVHGQPGMLVLNAPTLKMLGFAGVHTLTVHGALDLNTLDASLSANPTTPSRRLTRIEACCMVLDSADAQQTLDLLKRIGLNRTVSHQPMPVEVTGFRAITSTEAARLSATGSSNSSMAPTVEIAVPPEQGLELAQTKAIQGIAGRLSPVSTVEALLQYLYSPDSPAPSRPDVQVKPADLASFSLKVKLQVLKAFDIPDALIRQALAAMVRMAPPDIAPKLMRATLEVLLEAKFPMQKRDRPEEWIALARTMEKNWVSDTMTAPDAATVAPVDVLAGPQRANARPTTTTTNTTHITTTTTTTHSTRSADLSVEADPDGDYVAFISHVHPSTVAGVQQLKWSMDSAAIYARSSDDRFTLSAALWIIRQLGHRPLDNLASLPREAQQAVARLLLTHGQWQLFRHIAPMLSHWDIRVDEQQIAFDLQEMMPWSNLFPEAGQAIGLHLILPATLGPKAIAAIGELAQTTASGPLELTLEVNERTSEATWEAFEALACACSTTKLTIQQDISWPAAPGRISVFLSHIAPARLVEFALSGVPGDDEIGLTPLTTAVQALSATKLTIEHCGDGVLKALATCKPWACLTLPAVPSAAAELRNQAIAVETLSLKVVHPPIPRDHLLTIVHACKGVKVLDLWGARPDLDDVAHMLNVSRSISTLACDPSAESELAAERAMALLRQNLFLRHFVRPSQPPRAGSGLSITKATRIQILELTVRNQLFSAPDEGTDVEEFTLGAVRGLARTKGLGDSFSDLGVFLSGMLDGKSAQSLSVVSKATFAASREAWEARINRLVKRFELKVTTAQATALVGTWDKAQAWVQQQVKTLHNEGLSDAVIGEVLGRRLRQLVPRPATGPAPNAMLPSAQALYTIPHLLRAMLDVGALPMQLWLKEVMGIDVGTQPPSLSSTFFLPV